MFKFVPDGYFRSGLSRPWRKVEILETSGNMAKIKYSDTGETCSCPVNALSDVDRAEYNQESKS